MKLLIGLVVVFLLITISCQQPVDNITKKEVKQIVIETIEDLEGKIWIDKVVFPVPEEVE